MPKINPDYKPIAYKKAPVVPVAPQTGIVVSLADFIPGAINSVSVQPGFDARAIIMPPGSIAGVDPTFFIVVAYVTQTMSPASLLIPNVTGILVADLPNGMLPPEGSGGKDIYYCITEAIEDQLEPPKPGGTGNDNPVP